ncbi:hypothetical protein BV25DRAFT_1820657 [Artomyces pyxidatus]|uniref:Uncharacterized protein n=1 Tax=Artomyces pyxidatus TaxID=48021 RepID=A0ACB8TE20_9AGAM|nr:hypothetical protein BV25DRAFT_1820657 [Artomyces pyxidatus]
MAHEPSLPELLHLTLAPLPFLAPHVMTLAVNLLSIIPFFGSPLNELYANHPGLASGGPWVFLGSRILTTHVQVTGTAGYGLIDALSTARGGFNMFGDVQSLGIEKMDLTLGPDDDKLAVFRSLMRWLRGSNQRTLSIRNCNVTQPMIEELGSVLGKRHR